MCVSVHVCAHVSESGKLVVVVIRKLLREQFAKKKELIGVNIEISFNTK